MFRKLTIPHSTNASAKGALPASWLESVTAYFDAHPLLIFFVPFLIFLSNGREISSGDPIPTVFVAINLVKQGTIFLDDLRDYYPYHDLPYFVSSQKGHIVSNYPVFPGVMATPVFTPFVWLRMLEKGDGDLVWRYLAKLTGSMYCALSVLILYYSLKRLIDQSGALALSFAYGLGTAIWPVAAQSLWQHGPSVFWWSVCWYGLIRSHQHPERLSRWLSIAGTAAGCAVLCRTVNGIATAALCLIVLIQFGRKAVGFVLPAFLLTTLLIFYNVALFDSWKGGDSVLHTLHWELDRVAEGSWSTPLYIGFWGQLISPSRGLLVFSPFLLFSLAGMVVVWTEKEPVWKLIAYTAPIPILMYIVFGKYAVWWGGNSHYGPRYQIESIPFLIMYLSVVWKHIARSKVLWYSFVGLLIVSILIQWIGAFCYPSDWAVAPIDLSVDKDRLWSWTNNQIISCALSGVHWPF